MNSTIEKLIRIFETITGNPESFVSFETDRSDEIKLFVKNSYDFTKNEEDKSPKTCALPELILEDFDLEQIWQQIELQNEDLLKKSLVKVSKFVAGRSRLVFNELDRDFQVEEEKTDVNSEDSDDSETSETSERLSNRKESSDDLEDKEGDGGDDPESEDDNESSAEAKRKPGKPSIVDDDFFKLNEMEEFLKSEEKASDKKRDEDSGNESKEDEEEIDYFQSGSDGEGDVDDDSMIREKNPRYKDFFRPGDAPKPNRRNKTLEELEKEEELENDEELENEEESEKEEELEKEESEKKEENQSEIPDDQKDLPKSSFQLVQERLQKRIKHIEDTILSEKPWQLRGEITADNRPQNSLLEEVLEFDIGSRPAPVITEKTTFQLEDIIRQRIKDKAFDSVERKQKPVETPLEFKKKLVLDQEKNKESLAKIYEKEYLEQVDAVTGKDEEKEEEEPALHKEIKKMMQGLFRQLDALSNYHFTPKPAVPELKIVSNLPAIAMEEVAPVAATDASLLAPEEIKKRIKGDIIGKSERTDTDKKRERRKKKKKQQVHANIKKKKEMASKMKPGLGNKYSKEKMKKELDRITKDKNVDKMDESVGSKSVRSSTAFFKQLQEQVQSQIKNKTQTKRKQNTKGVSAKKMKL